MEKRKATARTRTEKRRTAAKPAKSGKAGNPAKTKASAIELDESDLEQVSGGVSRTFIKID